mgnify:CR=1 FL=1
MSSLLQNLIDRYPEAFDLLFFFVRLGLFVYIAVGLFPILRKHVLNWSNSNTNAPRPLNAPSVYNTQQAAHYTSQTQPNSLRLPSPERFVATLIRLYRASIINVRIGNCNVRIGGISGLLFLSFLLLLW